MIDCCPSINIAPESSETTTTSWRASGQPGSQSGPAAVALALPHASKRSTETSPLSETSTADGHGRRVKHEALRMAAATTEVAVVVAAVETEVVVVEMVVAAAAVAAAAVNCGRPAAELRHFTPHGQRPARRPLICSRYFFHQGTLRRGSIGTGRRQQNHHTSGARHVAARDVV